MRLTEASAPAGGHSSCTKSFEGMRFKNWLEIYRIMNDNSNLGNEFSHQDIYHRYSFITDIVYIVIIL